MTKNYVDKNIMLEEIKAYKKTKIISEKLHFIFYRMCCGIANKSNFINYTWKDDFIQDSYLKCILKIDKFNIEKKNPFAYFSTLIYNHILTYIYKEKKEYSKKENLKNSLYLELSNRYPNIDLRLLLEDECFIDKVNN